MANHGSLEGRRIVIVGGSSGIGLATAAAVEEAGGQVVVASRNDGKRAAALEELSDEARGYALDVSDEAAVREFFETLGGIDGLVLTAAYVPSQPFDELSTEEFRRTFDVKFWGYYYAAKHAAPRLSDDGAVVMTSGTAARKLMRQFFAIGVVNSAIETLAKYLALELAPRRVVAVNPGVVDTVGMDEERRERIAESLPVGKVGQPEEVADAVLFALTNEYLTGSVIGIDGGGTLT